MSVLTTWIKPINHIKGQDHLASRAVCEKLYTSLISGITNVTDRARYYSFYPWLIWAFEAHTGALKNKSLQETIRKAECLFTLIGEWHTRENKQEEKFLHGAAMIGREKLIPALNAVGNGEVIQLSTYSTLEESSQRYFKNKWGGLGQYYLGTLLELGILDGSTRTGLKYTRERGEIIAKAFDKEVNRQKFFEVLEEDYVSIKSLEELKEFCPCFLRTNYNGLERKILIDLFFNQPGAFYKEEGNNRRKTLGLILNLIFELEKKKENKLQKDFVEIFRSCVYTSTLPSGVSWNVPIGLESIRKGWQLYQCNEIFSIAVQSIFWAGLSKLQLEQFPLRESQEYKEWFLLTFAKDILSSDALNSSQEQLFEERLLEAQIELPLLENFSDKNHEMKLYNDLLNLSIGEEKEVISKALNILLVLAARYQENALLYNINILSDRYLREYPVNLHKFWFHCHNTWKTLTMAEFLGWLAMDWGIEWHFEVALRKLRYENKDTFRIKPTDQGLKVVEVPFPARSSPRITQAKNILYDLELIFNEEGSIKITTEGKQLMEECCG